MNDKPGAPEGEVLAILIVNYFCHVDVRELIATIPSVASMKQVISVVDNSCDDNEFIQLSEAVHGFATPDRRIALTKSAKNLGYGAGNNLAWQAVEADVPDMAVVLVMNPDTRWERGCPTELVGYAQKRPNAIVGAMKRQGGLTAPGLSSMNLVTGRSARAKRTKRTSVGYVDGHFLATAALNWIRLGGFEERYFLYCEEVDLQLRAAKLQHSEPLVCEQITVYHRGAGTTSEGGELSDTSRMHANRSRAILYRSHRRLWMWIPTLVLFRLGHSIVLIAKSRSVSAAKPVVSGLYFGLRARLPAPSTQKGM